MVLQKPIVINEIAKAIARELVVALVPYLKMSSMLIDALIVPVIQRLFVRNVKVTGIV